MVCFFGKSRAFLPSPMVSRNTWGSNWGPFLGAGGGRVRFRVRRDFCSIGVGRAVFVEPLDSRGEAMSTPPLIPRSNTLYPLLPWPRIALLGVSWTFFRVYPFGKPTKDFCLYRHLERRAQNENAPHVDSDTL